MSEGKDYFDRLVDKESLASYLESILGSVETFTIDRHTAGNSNETLFITWGEQELVLRRPPPGETAETAHDVLREYRVIDALQSTDVKVPPTVAASEDHSIIGSDFYIMKRVHGSVLRDEEPDQFSSPENRAKIGENLIRELATIHQIEYTDVGLGDFGYPEGYTERQVERWQEQFEWAFEVTEAKREVPTVYTVGDWLSKNTPSEYPHTLVHGDYKLDNVMFATSPPPELISVFDWELSTLGDPRFDLGWMLAYWWDEKDPAPPRPEAAQFMTQRGYSTRLELVDIYENLTGIEFKHERFYRALAVFKIAALGEMFYRRHIEGNADNPMYPKMETYVPLFLERARRIIEGDEPL